MAPSPARAFAHDDPLEFEWAPVDGTIIVNVFDGLPEALDDLTMLKTHLIWGAVLNPGDLSRVSWEDGFAVDANGTWSEGRPSRPMDGAYYLWLTAVTEGNVVAASDLIAFSYGAVSPWKSPGDSCKSDLAIPGDCDTPGAPQVCWQHTCRKLCASDADCPSSVCEVTTSAGFRICAL